MSELNQLRHNLNSVSDKAKRSSVAIRGLRRELSALSAEVVDTVGGAEREIDDKLVQVLIMAKGKLDSAVRALDSAANSTKRCAMSM